MEQPTVLTCPNETSIDVATISNTIQLDKYVTTNDPNNLMVIPSNITVTPKMDGTYIQVYAKLNQHTCYFLVKFECKYISSSSLLL